MEVEFSLTAVMLSCHITLFSSTEYLLIFSKLRTFVLIQDWIDKYLDGNLDTERSDIERTIQSWVNDACL